MKKTAIKFLALGIFLAACRIASAATHTISWSPATTYTDGTAISGATVTYSLYWSTSSSLSSVNTIATGLTGTSYVFDPSALGMSAGSTVYFAMKTALSTGAVSGYSTALSWSVPAKTLSGISISGASSVNEGATSAYTATATWSDGSTTAVTPTWSLSSTSYASISGSGVLTAASVTSNQTVTVNASYTSGGITKTATKSVTIANVAAALTGITISGAASVNEGGTALYSATASWSDGTTTAVSPTWSLAGTAYAAINSVGVLTAGSVSADQTVTVNASFTAGGATRTASRAVVVVNVEQPDPASARHLRISKPDTLPQDTWRLSWDAVTTYANGEELAAGAAVLYNVYWSRDPSLAADNLVLLTTATTATHVDFPPLSQGMVQQERVYFTLRTILGSGNPSALSEPLPWRVLNRSPVAPAKGKIGLKTIVSRN
jgi:plastocyanin